MTTAHALNQLVRLTRSLGIFRPLGVVLCDRLIVGNQKRLEMLFAAAKSEAVQLFIKAKETACAGNDNNNEIKAFRSSADRLKTFWKHVDYLSRRKQSDVPRPDGYDIVGVDRILLTLVACKGAVNAVIKSTNKIQEYLTANPTPSKVLKKRLKTIHYAESAIDRFHAAKRPFQASTTSVDDKNLLSAMMEKVSLGEKELETIQAAFDRVSRDLTMQAVKIKFNKIKNEIQNLPEEAKPGLNTKKAMANRMFLMMVKANVAPEEIGISPQEWKAVSGEERKSNEPFRSALVYRGSLLHAPTYARR